jgi:ATP-binding cassette subfamily B protein
MFAPVLVFCTKFERRYKVLARRAQDQDGDLTTLVEEASAGIRVLKALGRAPQAQRTHYAQAARLGRTRVEMAQVDGIFWSTLTLVPNAVIAVAVVLGALAVAHHQLTIGGLVAFITLALQLVWPVEALGYTLASGEEAATAAQRVLEIFDTAPAITDQPALAGRPALTAVARTETAEPGTVRFDDVSFAYPGGGEPVLRGVTLLYLLPRLADVTGGRVLLGGRDVREIPLPELRAAVGCAFEEATLFSASVRENVTFGVDSASEEEIEAALTAAQARFAYDLPWGLDTRIGEQGMALSGGQRQRVALARAIMSRPEVLVLDDPLSALDVQTEERVTEALHSVLSGVTALVVAHRPSTVALADRVALLQDGRIAAVGTHRELMARSAVYADLMSMEEAAP